MASGHLGEKTLKLAYLLLFVTIPGFISVWDVEDYCLNGKTSQPPEREYLMLLHVVLLILKLMLINTLIIYSLNIAPFNIKMIKSA